MHPKFVAALVPLVFSFAVACRAPDRSHDLVWPPDAEAKEIAELEDARSPGDGRLIALSNHADSAIRRRSVRALGRLPFPENGADVTQALLARLIDDDAAVRAEAAFALGFRGDRSAGERLLFVALDAEKKDANPNVRARAVEAASKLARPDLREKTLAALDDPDARVRLEAACGAFRWAKEKDSAARVDRALIEHLARETDRSVIAYTLFAFEQRKSLGAVGPCTEFAKSGDSTVRIFAVRALAAVLNDDVSKLMSTSERAAASSALRSRAADPDWRVAAEAARAISLERVGTDLFAQLSKSVFTDVRRAAWSGLAAAIQRASDAEFERFAPLVSENGGTDAGKILERARAALARAETSAMVRGDVLEAELRYCGRLASIPGAVAVPGVSSTTTLDNSELAKSLMPRSPFDSSPIARAGAARGFAFVPGEIAEPALRELAHDPDLAVATAAAESFARHDSRNSHETLLDLLFAKDVGVRLSAVTSLGAIIDERTSPQHPGDVAEFERDLPDYERVFDETHGDIANELKFNVLRNVAKIGGERATALLARAQGDDSAYVRTEARRLLLEAYAKTDVHPPAAVKIAPKLALVPLPGRDFPKYTHHPVVEMKTSRGVMRFELFPEEAPTHVHSFLELAKRGYYDGLTFHRVVPDFVIQGGDYRGDGNGGTTFRVPENVRELLTRGEIVPTDSLRHEIGARKFVRGSLGMPRNDDLDSGGSQFFVTHRETPHLDGRYTIFGELRAGFDVLDRIEVGDTIDGVTLVDDGR